MADKSSGSSGETSAEFVITGVRETPDSRSRNRRSDDENAAERIRENPRIKLDPASTDTQEQSSANSPVRPQGKARVNKADQEKQLREAKPAASMLVGTVEMFAVVAIGSEARFNPMERGMIEPSLARILSRMPQESIERFGSILDPLMLAVGFGWWGLRIKAQQVEKRVKLNSDVEAAIQEATGGLDPRSVSVPVSNGDARDADGIAAPPNDEILRRMNAEI